MKVHPKEVLLNLPIVLMFSDAYKVPEFAANINQLVHGKVKVKYEELGSLGDQVVGLFYLQRNDEFHQLREQFVSMIEQEQMREHRMQAFVDRMQSGLEETKHSATCEGCDQSNINCHCE